jgi:predicted DCC family thiol-disulfide oxidoreductase YuxK
MNDDDKGIVFFDGVCGLCNTFVDFLLKRQNAHRFFFAPLQGSTAAEKLPPDLKEKMDTVIYLKNGKIFTESSAALHILKDLGKAWPLLFSLIIVPPFIRNAVYRWVAENRFKWFGKKDSCRMPSPEERSFFLS